MLDVIAVALQPTAVALTPDLLEALEDGCDRDKISEPYRMISIGPQSATSIEQAYQRRWR